MTSEQLQATRATLWRQKADPILTLEDAQNWLNQVGLCLFLPRRAQIQAPAPSFVEACMGETNPTPPRAAIESARDLVGRLIDSEAAIPLNLLGTPADHPDFLVSKEALPFVYALRGDRDWKHAPASAGPSRVSPLITEVWKLLERRGVLTAVEIQEDLGRELTEAAVLRALHELWNTLRVSPLYQSGDQPALWEPLQSRYQKAIKSGGAMSRLTALSVLASVYLQSVVTGTSEDVEAFLSPLASRTKVREVVRGLSATRQLATLTLNTDMLLYVEGSLPEFPEVAPEKGTEMRPPVRARDLRARPGFAGPIQTRSGSRPANRSDRPGRPTPSIADGARRPTAGGRPEWRERPTGTGFRSASGRSSTAGRSNSSFGSKKPFGTGSSAVKKFETTPFPPRGPESREPGTGLRADGTPKKERWRNLPGGRPDQKGKPARFGPRKPEVGTGSRPISFTQKRDGASAKPFRPQFGEKKTFGARSGAPSRTGSPSQSDRFRRPSPPDDRTAGRSGSYPRRTDRRTDKRSGPPWNDRTAFSREAGSFRPRPDKSVGDRPGGDHPPVRPFNRPRRNDSPPRSYTRTKPAKEGQVEKPASRDSAATPARRNFPPRREESQSGGRFSKSGSRRPPASGRPFSGKPAGKKPFGGPKRFDKQAVPGSASRPPRSVPQSGAKQWSGSKSGRRREPAASGKPPAKFRKRPE